MKIKYINSHNLLKIATVILNEFLKKYQMKPSVIIILLKILNYI